MEPCQDQSISSGSPWKDSYLGSFHLPPDRISQSLFAKDSSTAVYTKVQKLHVQQCPPPPDAGSKAVIRALKNLQEKMRRLELERLQAEDNARRLSGSAQQSLVSMEPAENPAMKGTNPRNKELVYQLQSTEARCKLLEKQLDYMKKMLEKAEQDQFSTAEKQMGSLKDQADVQRKLQKLEKLERECQKLTSTQSASEKKVEVLEQKLLQQEHERRIVQEKTCELQRNFEADWHLQACTSSQVKRKKEKAKPVRKTAVVKSATSTSSHHPNANLLPFIVGTSTSPSHSVHANVQSALHLMKYHHPQLRERVHPSEKSASEAGCGAAALDSLSDLLMALQDELSQMSLEHQDLVMQIEETQKRELREDLERELDCLVKRMEDKGAQISHLKKHQAQVEKLKRKAWAQRRSAGSASVGCVREKEDVRMPSPCLTSDRVPVRPQHKGRQRDVQSPRQPRRLQTNLKSRDVLWEA